MKDREAVIEAEDNYLQTMPYIICSKLHYNNCKFQILKL